MRRMLLWVLSVVFLAGVCGVAWAEGEEPAAEWTVMIYLCGTDLESSPNQCATRNLRQIAQTVPVDSVNVVIETGGTQTWHTEETLGFEIANDRLQRWAWGKDGFSLADEQPEACMSHAETLSGFIRWSAENYPAKKYMLVLWDHGGGSNKGLICDEKYDMTIMPVFSLERALKEGGTHFDLILTDTCLMASLEMGQAVAPYADYLAASEEVMAGYGTSYDKWLQYLYDRPDCTGKQLGKQVCDLTQQFYVESGDSSTVSYFTMSVIDLSKIGAVAEATEAFMREAALLAQDPEAFYNYAQATYYVDTYMSTEMCDLFDLTRRAEQAGIPTGVTHTVQDAVEEAVVYFLRSPNHSYSHGLSIWYKLNADDKTLDHFARTCKNAEQLAFFDAVNLSWDAPEWVYEKAERHPALNRTDYVIELENDLSADGKTALLTFKSGDMAVASVSYELMYEEEESGICYTLGESGDLDVETDEETGKNLFCSNFDGRWPTLAGVPLSMSMVDDMESCAIFNVDVNVGEDDFDYLRVVQNFEKTGTDENGETVEKPDYELQGFWDGFDEHTGLPGRNIRSLSEYKGRNMTLFKQAYSKELKKVSAHIAVTDIPVTEDMAVTKEPLPAGQYLYRFVVRDVFGNRVAGNKLLPVNWDGEKVWYPAEEEK